MDVRLFTIHTANLSCKMKPILDDCWRKAGYSYAHHNYWHPLKRLMTWVKNKQKKDKCISTVICYSPPALLAAVSTLGL